MFAKVGFWVRNWLRLYIYIYIGNEGKWEKRSEFCCIMSAMCQGNVGLNTHELTTYKKSWKKRFAEKKVMQCSRLNLLHNI